MNFEINEEKRICNIPIAGIQPLTTIDYPGKVSAVFFTMGCTWNCRYCHNRQLRNITEESEISFDEINDFIEKRREFLEGIVISGGEPTIHESLPEFMEWLKSFGFSLALHTNGDNPDMLRLIFKRNLVDYVAMDVKSSPIMYEKITGVKCSCVNVARSIQLILSSGIDYEFRTTYHPALMSEKDLMDTVTVVHGVGAKRFFIQKFQPNGVDDSELKEFGDIIEIPNNVVERANCVFDEFCIR